MDRNDHDGTAVTTARGLNTRASDNNGYRIQNRSHNSFFELSIDV